MDVCHLPIAVSTKRSYGANHGQIRVSLADDHQLYVKPIRVRAVKRVKCSAFSTSEHLFGNLDDAF